MYSVNIKKLKTLVVEHVNKKVPLMMTGGYGIGKSESIIQVCQTLADQKKKELVVWNKITPEKKTLVEKSPNKYYVIVDERLSEYDQSDLKGIPCLDGDHCNWLPQRWLKVMTTPDVEGLIFFDEINLASKDVQASAYKIIHDRFINDVKLSEDVAIIACGNRLKDEANVITMPRPLRDRMSEVEIFFDVDEFFKYAELSHIHHQLMAFFKFRPDRCLRLGEDKEDKSTTPRGIFRASSLLGDRDVRDAESRDLLSVAIGEVVANEIIGFIKLSDTIDLKAILKKPSKIKEVKEISTKYSVISAFVEMFRKDIKLLDPLVEICNELDLEFGILMLRLMLQAQPDSRMKLMSNATFTKNLSEKFYKILKED